jgi:hypothetical protein
VYRNDFYRIKERLKSSWHSNRSMIDLSKM